MLDVAVERVKAEGFSFPLGVYPIEPMSPRQGFTMEFEPADGGEEDAAGGEPQWEEWPDR